VPIVGVAQDNAAYHASADETDTEQEEVGRPIERTANQIGSEDAAEHAGVMKREIFPEPGPRTLRRSEVFGRQDEIRGTPPDRQVAHDAREKSKPDCDDRQHNDLNWPVEMGHRSEHRAEQNHLSKAKGQDPE